MIRPVVRALAALISLISVVFGAALPAAALTAPSFGAPSYAYESSHHRAVLTGTATERGPPFTTYDYASDAVDDSSRGASARPSEPTARASYDRDHTPRLVSDDSTPGSTVEPFEPIDVTLGALQRLQVAAKSADEFVDLASASRRSHILDGEVRPNGTFGGGHRPGTGFPGKSEFPAGWSDDRIMHEISMSRPIHPLSGVLATDPVTSLSTAPGAASTSKS